MTKPIFKTNRRIKLGIWGLGRGMNFYKTCEALNIDVVAGCDYNEHMRTGFLKANPGAFVTADADEFLARDFDAVLLATFCPAHADDAIKCLRAGKHVLSEVTSFHTMAEGVRLVDEVERSGKVYNLAENYPFSAANMYLARRWKEGLFGDLMYAEYEYVHECRSLAYTYIDGLPVQPGNTVHNWRSWLHFHYYCTHSLGPVMIITGTRPTRVVALPGKQTLAGYLMSNEEGMGGVTPSLINMSNGAIVRNLMGATTNDSHVQRIWGTLGAAEINVGKSLSLRLGGSGGSPKFEVIPRWDSLGALAAKTGHGGGDFWILYYFARQILFGDKAPFDIYSACDVTIPGILAYRSSTEGGRPYDVPDYRDKAARDAWRDDNWDQKRLDVTKVFPADSDFEITRHFSATMAKLVSYATMYRAYADWGKVWRDMSEPSGILSVAGKLIDSHADMRAVYAMALKIARAYPACTGARVLNEMLALGGAKAVLHPLFLKQIKRQIAVLRKQIGREQAAVCVSGTMSTLQPEHPVASAAYPSRDLQFIIAPVYREYNMLDVRPVHGGRGGIVYVRTEHTAKKAGRGRLLFGADGPVRAWFNRKPVAVLPNATNPCTADHYKFDVMLKKGVNEIMFAINANKGRAWGIIVRVEELSAGRRS